jgi:hypothetical protein
MVAPAVVASLSMIFGGRLDGPDVQSVVPYYAMPILESGRVFVALALTTKVIRTRDQE